MNFPQRCIFASRNGQNMTDETVARINEKVQNGTLMEDDFPFLGYLLGKKELSYKDVSIITLSLFSDGLSTVRWVVNRNKSNRKFFL